MAEEKQAGSPKQQADGEVSSGYPLVWIVVLHFQGGDCTKLCLESLRRLHYPNFKVLLLDNGSPDHSGDGIARLFSEFSYLCLPDNLGFAGGCNAGFNYCQSRGAEWVWLLNNDTRVDPQSLSQLMLSARSHGDAAALGAMVFTPAGEEYVASGAGEINFLRAKTLMAKQVPDGTDVLSCQWLSGCNLLLRSKAFSSINGFDEAYFLYFEDTDLCYRLRQAGWDCLLVPSARVEHIGGASTEGSLSTWRSYYYTRNRLLFFLRYLKGSKALPAIFSIAGHLLRHLLVLPWRGERGRRQLKAELLGLRDYLANKLGKADCLDW